MIFPQTKRRIKNTALTITPSKRFLKPKDVATARKYITNYWSKLERYHPKDTGSLVGLPHPYLIPSFHKSSQFSFEEQYYWDSYFMMQGFLKDTEHQELVTGTLGNLTELFKRFDVIPNGSRTYYTSRSQPPLLTTFIFDVYEAYSLSKTWLKNAIEIAEEEYHKVWLSSTHPHNRKAANGLSRYYDANVQHSLAECESGWDMTTRFEKRALDFLPVDLNALLYKYETDFAKAATLLGDNDTATNWQHASSVRKKMMNKLMWNDKDGLYYDYDYVNKRRGTVKSLASYYPMWVGMADEKQAKKLAQSLQYFEKRGGLATTQLPPVSSDPISGSTQWAHPNGWAPLQYIVIKALERYGYTVDSRRLAHKWLRTNLRWFKSHHTFLEKYNVASPKKQPAKGLYPAQSGFGWTNAVFERLCQDYVDPQDS